jgi:hypothetical protein
MYLNMPYSLGTDYTYPKESLWYPFNRRLNEPLSHSKDGMIRDFYGSPALDQILVMMLLELQ